MVNAQFGYTFLKNELGRYGLDLSQMRVTSMWLHAPNKSREDCEWNIQQAMQEAMGKRFVLLLGTGATSFFLKKTATAISGLPMKSDFLGAEFVMGTLNPNSALAGCNGETMLGIKKFALLYKEERNNVK